DTKPVRRSKMLPQARSSELWGFFLLDVNRTRRHSFKRLGVAGLLSGQGRTPRSGLFPVQIDARCTAGRFAAPPAGVARAPRPRSVRAQPRDSPSSALQTRVRLVPQKRPME